MNEPRKENVCVRYFCTAGNGMEPFLTDEVKRKLKGEDVCQMSGKVLFSSSAAIGEVIELKAAERLFLLLKHDSPVKLSANISPAKAASVLQSKLLGDRSQWSGAVLTWSRLQGELADRRTAVNAPSVVGRDVSSEREDEEEGRGSEEQMGEEEEEEQRRAEERGAERLEGESCGDEDYVEKKKMKMEEACALENKDHEKTTGGEYTPFQPGMIKPDSTSSVPVSFRISCKCTGSLSRHFRSTQEVSKVIGLTLCRELGWKVDLKNPQLEVNVSLSDDHCLLGIPLTKSPLANRSYIKTTGLRSTVAWAMASLAQIQPGFCVVDPMCGVGTILIEAAQEHKDACFLGVDIDDRQLENAKENIAALGKRIHLLKASSMALPLAGSCVDAVVCDVPFGRKFGTKANMAANLPVIVTEMERVLRVGGALVLLLSPQLSCLLKKRLAQNSTGLMSDQETKNQTGKQDSSSPPLFSTTAEQTFQIHQGVKSAPTQEKDTQTGPNPSVHPAVSTLKLQKTLRVSLGAIDGLIQKYVKMESHISK